MISKYIIKMIYQKCNYIPLINRKAYSHSLNSGDIFILS